MARLPWASTTAMGKLRQRLATATTACAGESNLKTEPILKPLSCVSEQVLASPCTLHILSQQQLRLLQLLHLACLLSTLLLLPKPLSSYLPPPLCLFFMLSPTPISLSSQNCRHVVNLYKSFKPEQIQMNAVRILRNTR